MAYARRGELDSDVYVWSDGAVWYCADCPILHGETPQVATRAEMLAHLEQHIARGDVVPTQATDRLIREIKGEARKSHVCDNPDSPTCGLPAPAGNPPIKCSICGQQLYECQACFWNQSEGTGEHVDCYLDPPANHVS